MKCHASLTAVTAALLAFTSVVSAVPQGDRESSMQSGAIRGLVQPCIGDADGIEVYIPGRAFFVRVGSDGAFQIGDVPVGTYTLKFSRQGQALGSLSGIQVDSHKVADAGIFSSCADQDGDGYTVDLDCQDQNPAINPGVAEQCDGLDNNCNGSVDEQEAVGTTDFYLDLDGDGYGDDGQVVSACDLPPGYASVGGDCDDMNEAINPGAVEVCGDIVDCGDVVDNNCDGKVDEGCNPCPGGSVAKFFEDADGDGFGDPHVSLLKCAAPLGYVMNSDDLDDSDATVF